VQLITALIISLFFDIYGLCLPAGAQALSGTTTEDLLITRHNYIPGDTSDL
jgi:hypothetical protein